MKSSRDRGNIKHKGIRMIDNSHRRLFLKEARLIIINYPQINYLVHSRRELNRLNSGLVKTLKSLLIYLLPLLITNTSITRLYQKKSISELTSFYFLSAILIFSFSCDHVTNVMKRKK